MDKEEDIQHEKKNSTMMVEIEQEKLDSLVNEAAEFKNKYLHLLADVENSRKRLQKERAEISQYALSSVILDFLHPIDHMENALGFTEQSSEEVRHWAIGFDMILNQLKEVLARNGVVPIEALGKEFDPHLHEAVEMVESDTQAPGTIVEESLKGYSMRGKTLRPSKVKVAKEIKKNEEIENNRLSEGENNE